jgi:hypothetical protein
MVVRDVRTRWNSTHAMIARALLLREVRSLENRFHFSSLIPISGNQRMDLSNGGVPRPHAHQRGLEGAKAPGGAVSGA